ncbi:MAG: beta-ketoacyl-ACP synthase [Marinicella sp.]
MNPVGIKSFAMSCALGSNHEEIWNNVIAASTQGMVFDENTLFEGHTYLGKAQFAKNKLKPFFAGRVNQFLAAVANQLDLDFLAAKIATDPVRVGVVLGTSTSGVDQFEAALGVYDECKQWPKDYLMHQQRMANVSEFLADYLGAKGPVMSVSTACSSSAKAMLSAKRWLDQGLCDVVIAGGIDVLCQLTVNGFNALGALSQDKTLPFSRNRSGINIGEAAALFILTKDEAAINLMGGGETSDAYHISAPDPSGQGAIDAMNLALADAGLNADQIDYVNLHGTGTGQNDLMESLAVNSVFGANLPCSSSKPMTGHTLGAAGALEIGLCALSMSTMNRSGQYIPHVYDGETDTELKPLNLVVKNNHLGLPQYALSNSFAFGGSNASIIIGRQHE